MKDQGFVLERAAHCRTAGERARQLFGALTETQFNWKPNAKSWSIAQCLEHLCLSDRLYFELLQSVGNGTYQTGSIARFSPFTGFLGRLMVNQLKEEARSRMKTAPKLEPVQSSKALAFLQEYITHTQTFAGHIQACANADLDQTITSPVLTIITYPLRDTLQFLVQHEHRHINQAVRVMDTEGFPGR